MRELGYVFDRRPQPASVPPVRNRDEGIDRARSLLDNLLPGRQFMILALSGFSN